ncbi:MAG: amidohydrolase family protein [Bacteroidetes bacterium]|jgi:imidazolonepropionase-like amidohydrolase|nr:amidohydrolase family protein [Bacteroidota bacterium]
MKYINSILFLLVLSICCGFYFIPGKVHKKPALALIGVNVIPMNKEQVLKDQVVVIENGKIRSITDRLKSKLGKDVQTIDASGKYLVPGFFDMHAHFFYEQGNNVNTCAEELKVMLANGLTTVRIECGDSVYLDARKKVEENVWTGPKLFVASPQFVGKWAWPGKVFAEICTTPKEAEVAVRKCKKQGYDEIKITFMVKRDVYDAIIKTAKEENIKVTGHVGPLVKLPAALQAKQQIEHMDEFIDMLLPDTSYNHGECVSDMNIWRKNAWATVPFLDENKIPALVKSVKEAGICVTPTNYFFFSSFADSIPKEEYMKRTDYGYIPSVIIKDRWEIREHYWKNPPLADKRKKYIDIRKKITYALWKAGVPLMAGSDSPEWFLVQGFSIHDELEVFTKAGVSNYGALETVTKNPATYAGVIKNKGTIEAGKDADLILLDKNPLENISNTRSINTMILGGELYDRKSLDKMLGDAKKVLSK